MFSMCDDNNSCKCWQKNAQQNATNLIANSLKWKQTILTFLQETQLSIISKHFIWNTIQ
jgi:hypothetical protein